MLDTVHILGSVDNIQSVDPKLLWSTPVRNVVEPEQKGSVEAIGLINLKLIPWLNETENDCW